jgi:AbrB family looped-hinge helix DNA binding protein
VQKTIKKTLKMKIFQKGQVVIPADLRRKYNINIGDQIEFLTFQDGILLKPFKHRPKDQTLTEELFGVFSNYVAKGNLPDKEAIVTATESGFLTGWSK